MKKLVAALCCIYLLNNLPKTSTVAESSERSKGQKVLVKAIAAIVNTESAKKMPPKTTFVASSDAPLF